MHQNELLQDHHRLKATLSPPCIHFLSLSTIHHQGFFNANPSIWTLNSPSLNIPHYLNHTSISMHTKFYFSQLMPTWFLCFYKTKATCLCGYFYDFFYCHTHLDTMSMHTSSAASACRFSYWGVNTNTIANYQFRVLPRVLPCNSCYDVEAIIILFTSYNCHTITTLRLAPRCFQHLSSYWYSKWLHYLC